MSKNNNKDNKENNKDKVIAYDETSIKIYDKYFDVNQDLPNSELLNNIIQYQTMYKNIDVERENYSKMIEIISNKQSELLASDLNNSEIIETFNKLEQDKDSYNKKLSNIFNDTLSGIFNIIEWILGKEAIEYINNKKISFNEVANILDECIKRNVYLSEYIKKKNK